jgi:MFS family permease
MPLIYNVGSVIGPAMGGALSNPYNRKRGDPSDGPLLWRFPYALPNIAAAAFFLFGITTGILFLEETLASKKHQPDRGLILGKKLIALTNGIVHKIISAILRCFGKKQSAPPATPESYTPVPSDEETLVASKAVQPTEKDESPSYSEVLGKQTVISLINYWMLAMHNTAYDQIIAVYMHHPRSGPDVRDRITLPFGFNRGLGMGKCLLLLFST